MNYLQLAIKQLNEFVTNERVTLFYQVLNQRTRYLTIVLEDIYQPQNASAVLRSADCFGIQDVHIIENNNKYNVNPDVALGSDKWLTLNKHNKKNANTVDTIKYLKEQGYRIVATTPHTDDVTLDEFSLEKGKAALFFGTELNGLSKTVLNNADEYLKVPMYGFTESFNISVSASIIMHDLIRRLHHTDIEWQLSIHEKRIILFRWLMQSIKKSDILLKELSVKHNLDFEYLNQFL